MIRSLMATCARPRCRRKTSFAAAGVPLCSTHRKGRKLEQLLPVETYKVTACEVCPFVAHGFEWCAHPLGGREGLSRERAMARPDWCPLNKGSILIEAAVKAPAT